MVVIPGEEGNMGILPGHAPVISTLRPGTIAVFENGAVVERIFVAGGFAEVTPQRCTVLAEEAVPVPEIDRGVVDRQIRDLKDDLQSASDDAARQSAQSRLAIAEAKLQAAENPVY